MHGHTERAVQDNPPVTELIMEAFHHQGAVARHHFRGLLLLAQVGQEVAGRPLVQPAGTATGCGVFVRCVGEFTDKPPERPPELHGPAERVTLPERQLAGLPEGGGDQHPVMRDVLDPPARGAEGEDVTHAGLVDHFLVQLTDPPAAAVGAGIFGSDEVDTEQPAVGDGAARGDGQPLCAGPARDGAFHPVPDDAGPQLGELVRRVPSREKVQGGIEGGARESGKRGGPAHDVEPLLDVDGFQRGGRDRLLGQDVQRVGGNVERLDLAGQHPLDRDGGVQQIPAVLREEHALGNFTHLVAGPADSLQPAGHGVRRFHLDHQVHRTHVDAQFQRRRRHHTAQPAGLQVILDQGALVLGNGPVVGAGQQRLRAFGLPGLGHQFRRRALRLRCAGRSWGLAGRIPEGGGLQPFGVDFIQACGEPFGQAARVRKDNR